MKGASGFLAGGFFNVEITGPGMAAFCTLGPPLTLMAGPNRPLATDPQATVAWSGSLAPRIRTDISFKSIIGRGSGEEFQMVFEGPGEGFVICQPFEELPISMVGKH